MKKEKTYMEYYILALQIFSLLPLPYFALVVGSARSLLREGVCSFLFRTGIECLPRLWTLFLSFLYRITLNEIAVYFTILLMPLFLSLFLKKRINDRKFITKASYVFLIVAFIGVVLRTLDILKRGADPYNTMGYSIELFTGLLLLSGIRRLKESA